MKKCNKIFVVLSVVILFTFIFNNSYLFAAVNSSYGTNSKPVVAPQDIDEAVEDNGIINTIGEFIYFISLIFESLISSLLGNLTGNSFFPYADKTIFNALPLLDINFINPSMGSMYATSTGNTTIIANIIQNIYYTVFTLSITFLGVCVGIMAIRLIFSSIASEKAKYKQAIVNFLMSFLLVFLSHYLISFIFYVNEKMVEVASTIVTSNLENAEVNSVSNATQEQKKEIVKEYFLGENNIADKISLDNETHVNAVYALISNDSYTTLMNSMYVLSPIIYVQTIDDAIFIIDNLSDSDANSVKAKIDERNKSRDYYSKKVKDEDKENLSNILLMTWYNLKNNNLSGNAEKALEEMGDFFKKNAVVRSVSAKGYTLNRVSLIGAILYAMFIVQSIMFFISYAKRFFYITILSLFAPVVIIFDFLTKSLK